MTGNITSSRKTMIEIVLALTVGIFVGVIFSAFKLPVPAPPAIAGVVGILGIYLGAQLWPFIVKLFS
ncbi:MAG: DUF1427 family protein [Roseibacillus sp.]|jgi:XapX domain-containing protein|nr:DUF1427 family protein [Roseibacillus sp.]